MKVVIVDDDKLVCMSLKTILEASNKIQVLGTGYNGKDAILLFRKYRPDVLLMDIRMELMNGLDAAKDILEEYPEANILFLTTFSDDEYIVRALHIGAKGYILKQDFESIVPALSAVFSGQSVFGGEIVSKLPSILHQEEKFDYAVCGITEKELEIIEKVSDGLSNKEIAKVLFLSEGTVRNYLSNILEKLNLRDRTQLAVFYFTGKCSYDIKPLR